MRLGQRRNEPPEINLTPLIDVVFLLLIFFMVSTTFDRASELAIELPTSSSEQRSEPVETLEISIDAQGRYYVGGRQLVNTQASTLREAMIRAAEGRDSPPVVVNADAAAPYQSVVTLMDVSAQLNYARLRFATRPGEEGQ